MYRMRAKMIDMSTKHFSMNFFISTFCKDLSIILYFKKDSKNTQKDDISLWPHNYGRFT